VMTESSKRRYLISLLFILNFLSKTLAIDLLINLFTQLFIYLFVYLFIYCFFWGKASHSMFDNCYRVKYCFFVSTDMAKLHSLLALRQFMQGVGEDMDEAELVRSTGKIERTNKRSRRTE